MTTNQLIKHKFEAFCKLYNLHTSAKVREDNNPKTDYYSNSFVKMDYSPAYGGYRIDIVNTNTSERFFCGQGRLSGKEMICYLDGLIDAKSEYTITKDIIKSSVSVI